MITYVWDDTTLAAFFGNAPDLLLAQWYDAQDDRIRLVWPAAAVAAANHQVGAAWDSWHPLLYGITTTDLTAHAAIDAGRRHEDVAVAHVLHEAHEFGAWIVTTAPARYAGLGVPVLPV